MKRDPKILAQQENYKRRVDAEKREEAKLAKRMKLQRVEAAKLMDRAGVGLHVEASVMDRSEGDAPVTIKIGGSKRVPEKKAKKKSIVFDDESDGDSNDDGNLVENQIKPMVALEHNRVEASSTRPVEPKTLDSRKRKAENMHKRTEETKTAKYQYRTDLEDVRKKYWLFDDILVRIISKRSKFYKRKGIVNKVRSKYTAKVEILDSGPGRSDGGDIIEFDQEDLESVVPRIGKRVLIINGKCRGSEAILISADDDKCRGKLELSDGTVLKKVDFDDFSKLMSE